MTGRVKAALVIAGHGSHLSPRTAAPAWQHADSIRTMGLFEEVTCAFWKEAPSLRRVLDTLSAEDITIVPLFTSQGYFSQTVLPSELGLKNPPEGKVIRYTETVGQHPHMRQVVSERAEGVIRRYGLDPSKTALALAGHGTRRDRNSAAATKHQADQMRETGRFAEVVAIYMDEPPEIESVYAITRSPSIIVVPFFVADGSHTQEDIPTDLRLSSDPRRIPYSVPTLIDGRAVYYTSAVGMEPSVADVIVDLAREAGAPLREKRENTDLWTGFPQAGLDLLRIIQFPFCYGQVIVERRDQAFMIRWTEDKDQELQQIETPAVLREFLAYDANGNFRALRTGTDLRGGWQVEVEGYERLLAVLETIYPGVWIDYTQHQEGKLPVQTVQQVVERQTGLYKRVGRLPENLLPGLVKAHCGLCVRNPTWFEATSDQKSLPCPEPCQCWMSFALQEVEALRGDQHSLDLTPDDIASLRAALQAAIEHPAQDVRPAEYSDPRNPARLRALLARLP
jgi:sirohydrochlorin cobaltochelatase